MTTFDEPFCLNSLPDALFGKIYINLACIDHARIMGSNKYLCKSIKLYFRSLNKYDSTLDSIVPPLNWLITHLSNNIEFIKIDRYNECDINAGYNFSEYIRELYQLFKHKTKLKSIDLATTAETQKHFKDLKYTDIMLFLETLFPSNGGRLGNFSALKHVNLTGFEGYPNNSWYLGRHIDKYIAKLNEIKKEYNVTIQRLPDWFIGDWILYEYKQEGFIYGEIHSYPCNGIFKYDRDSQNIGIVDHTILCKDDMKTVIHKLIIDMGHVLQNSQNSFYYTGYVLIRKYELNPNEIHKIKNDSVLQKSIQKLPYYKDMLNKPKSYHFEGIEVIQNRNLMYKNWPQNNMDPVSKWFKIRFD